MIFRYFYHLFGFMNIDCNIIFNQDNIIVPKNQLNNIVKRNFIRTGNVPWVGQEFMLEKKINGEVKIAKACKITSLHLSCQFCIQCHFTIENF